MADDDLEGKSPSDRYAVAVSRRYDEKGRTDIGNDAERMFDHLMRAAEMPHSRDHLPVCQPVPWLVWMEIEARALAALGVDLWQARCTILIYERAKQYQSGKPPPAVPLYKRESAAEARSITYRRAISPTGRRWPAIHKD